MPATLREVLKTNTFEQQRQIINTLGVDFRDYVGGTGFSSTLKLDDGTAAAPAAFFASEPTVGLYKSGVGAFAISTGNSVATITDNDSFSVYRRQILQKNDVVTTVSQNAGGTSYHPGSFVTPVSGGAGSGLLLNVNVSNFTANITNPGSNYPAGLIQNLPLTGGSGVGGTVDITVSGVELTVTNAGSGYPADQSYTGIATSGAGNNDLTIGFSVSASGTIDTIVIENTGTGYANGDTLSIDSADLEYVDGNGDTQPGTGSGLVLTVSNNPYQVIDVVPYVNWYGVGYVATDSCGVSGTATGAGLAFTLTGYGIPTLGSPAIVNGGNGYQVDDTVSDGYVRNSSTEVWSGILKTFTYTVTVDNDVFNIDLNDGNGPQANPTLTFAQNAVYNFIFTNAADYTGNPLTFGTAAEGSTYTTNVNELSVLGTGVQIYVDQNTPSTLYYFSPSTTGFGNSISVLTTSQSGFSVDVDAISEESSFAVDLTGGITSGGITASGDVGITGGLTVTQPSTFGDLYVDNLVIDAITNNGNLGVAGDVTIDNSLYVQTDKLVVDNTTGFVGINVASLYDGELEYYDLTRQLEIYGEVYNEGDVNIAQGTADIVNIGPDGGSGKLNVSGAGIFTGNLNASDFTGSYFTAGSGLTSQPSYTFSTNNLAGLYYDTANDFVGVTGSSGLIVEYGGSTIRNFRDTSYIYTKINDYGIIAGSGYTEGQFSGIELTGGTGNGLTVDIVVAFDVKITEPGTGYTPGTYLDVPLSGGTGNSDAVADIEITNTGVIVDNVLVTNGGSGYTTAPIVVVTETDINGAGADAVMSASLDTTTGTVKSISVNAGGNYYTSAPSVIIGNEWSTTNTVEVNSQYFYGNNLYTVTGAGITDAANPPTHTSGSVLNGTATFTYVGVAAKATATLGTVEEGTDDAVDSVTVTVNGSGYNSNPSIGLSGGQTIPEDLDENDPDPENAQLSATTGFAIGSVKVLDGGSGYVSPAISFTGGNPDTNAIATASVAVDAVSTVTIKGGTNYAIGNTLTFSHTDLVDENLQTSVAPTTPAELEITAVGSLSYLNITDFGEGYVEGDVLTVNIIENPELSTGTGFAIQILETIDEQAMFLDVSEGELIVRKFGLENTLTIDNSLILTGDSISKISAGNLVISADYVEIGGTGALLLPSGDTSLRPAFTADDAGAIRFNTDESRFEGFDGSYFVSLGGVRDVDGNTYISAELNPGDDDNIIRFVNDDTQSMQVEQSKVTFQTISNIDKTEINGIPVWEAGGVGIAPADLVNDPPNLIYFETRVYSIVTTGTFDASTGPTHTTGTVANGSVDLTYVRSIYGSLTYAGTDLNLQLDKLNLNNETLSLSGSIATSSRLNTESTSFLFSFGSSQDTFIKYRNDGSLLVNNGFGATEDLIQVLDYQLKQFDLKDTRIVSNTGGIDTSAGNAVNIVLVEYDAVTSSLPLHSGKVLVEIVDDSATPRRQYSEVSYLVKSDLTDILYTEINKIYTDDVLCDVSVGLDGSNNITVDVVDATGSSTTVYSIKAVSQAILV